MADLAVLRTAKQAMDEGLISQEEFDQIKVAFTKAQQIKAGLDAGFIREEDYMQARDSFLQSLDFKVHGPQAMLHSPATSVPIPSQFSGGGAPIRPPGTTYQQTLMPRGGGSGAGATAQPAAPQLQAPPVPAAPALPMNRSNHQLAAAATAAAAAPPRPEGPPPPSNSGEAPGTVPVPTDLARIGRPNQAEGKKSMSGIGVHSTCINLYNHIKTRSAYKWVSYKIDDAGAEVVIDQVGATDSTYEQFLATLPHNQCRFAVYDYAYANADTGQTNQKLVFVHWAPQGSSTKSKMMYASTKEFLKGFLEGVGAEVQADTLEELDESEVVARIAASMARK